MQIRATDAHGLAGELGAEIDLALAKTDAHTAGYAIVVNRVG